MFSWVNGGNSGVFAFLPSLTAEKAQPHRDGETVPFRLLLLGKPEDSIHMPRGFVGDREGDVADEEVDDGGFGDDICMQKAFLFSYCESKNEFRRF